MSHGKACYGGLSTSQLLCVIRFVTRARRKDKERRRAQPQLAVVRCPWSVALLTTVNRPSQLRRYRRLVRLAHMTMTAPAAGPKIYTGRARPLGVAASGRLLALAISVACLAVLVIACGLPPSADGYGTHLQLGMAQCGFLARTGLPCPACGMTTSFAWFARGNLAASFYIQPMGMALALICGCGVWGSRICGHHRQAGVSGFDGVSRESLFIPAAGTGDPRVGMEDVYPCPPY